MSIFIYQNLIKHGHFHAANGWMILEKNTNSKLKKAK